MIDKCIVCGENLYPEHSNYCAPRVRPGLINYGKNKRFEYVYMCDDCFHEMVYEFYDKDSFGELVNDYLNRRNG